MTIYAISKYNENDYTYFTDIENVKENLKMKMNNKNYGIYMVYTIEKNGHFKIIDRFIYVETTKKWKSFKFKELTKNQKWFLKQGL